MKPRLRMIPLSAILLLAPLAFSQEQSSPAPASQKDGADQQQKHSGVKPEGNGHNNR